MGKRSREKREKKESGEVVLKKERPETGFVSLCKKIILFGVFLILFTPLIINENFLFPFVAPKSLYFIGLVLIVFTLYLLLISLKPKYRPKFNILLIAIASFIAVATISSFLGENLSYSFWSKYERMTGLLMLSHLFIFFVILSSFFKKREDWFKIFGVSVFVALIVSLIALLIKININLIGTLGPISQDGATIGNSSFLGIYLLFNIFLALYLLIKTTGGLRVFSGISLVIMILTLLISDARASILSLFGGLLLLFLFWLIFYKKGIFRFTGIALLVALIVIVFFITWLAFQPNSFINERLIQAGFGARFIVWESSLQNWLERPWFGWGLESFELVFARHFNPLLFLPRYGGEIWFDRAHNIIIDTLVTTGIIGLLSYLGIFIAAFYLLWSRYLKEKICFWTAGIFSSLLIAYFIQNLTVFDMVSSFMMFFLVLGFIASAGSDSTTLSQGLTPWKPISRQLKKNLNPLLVIIAFAFLSISFFHFVAQPLRAGHYVIATLRTKQGSSERLDFYKKTLATSPLGREQARLFFADAIIGFSFTDDGAQTKAQNPEGFKRAFDFLIQELEKNVKESPSDFRSYLALGNLYSAYANLNPQKFDQAERVFGQAIEISPLNPQGYWYLARTKLYQEDFETAILLVERAIIIEPRISRSHFLLVQIIMLTGDIELARERAREAIKINPDWEIILEGEEFLGEEII